VIPFSVEFEEKFHAVKGDPAKTAEFLKESKVNSKLDKIVTEGFTKLALQYYFTGTLRSVSP
jgi:obg-like ATPase 1